jgi:exopolyphosphatase / guanosine-5'-triphosphate,3'-diphosphate pyrophosphatase
MPRYAAVDIGSNSIRMEVAETLPGSPMRILASDREVTRLGESVFKSGRISEEAAALACTVLARMAARYQALDVAGVRAVATSSVRDARNQATFLERASRAAGTQVEVISGREEARLICLGVQSRWPQPKGNVLLVDIGGGSAEIIAGQDGKLRDAVSKPLGAVRLRELFLANDPPGERELHQMHGYIREKLKGVVQRLDASHWDRAVATSATASAVACAINGIRRVKRGEADRLRASTPQIRRLYEKLIALGLAGRRKITGIGVRRAELIVPGIAVLLDVLEMFGLPSAYYSAAGVRDGIIADLAARGVGGERAQLSADQHREVERMSVRYGVQLKHSRHVAAFARALFGSLQSVHRLPLEYGKILEGAAYLHDIGHFVSDLAHHKHSYYLAANSEMPGFTSRERELIANLARYHRKALPSTGHTNLRGLPADDKAAVLRLIPLLRMADSLDRSHEQRIVSIDCQARNGAVAIELNSGKDIDLEQWAAERAGDLFRQVYGVPVTIAKKTVSEPRP